MSDIQTPRASQQQCPQPCTSLGPQPREQHEEKPDSTPGDANDTNTSTPTTATELVSPASNVLVIDPSSPMLAGIGSSGSGGSGMSSPVRVPGTFPPEWLPDHETDTCMACECQFTLIKRRHHCRSCGKIFCSDCCKQKARLPYMDSKEARVCNNCHNLIECTLACSANSSRTGIGPAPPPPSSHMEQTGHQQQRAQATRDNQSSSSEAAASSYNTAARPSTSAMPKVQGVLKTSNQAARLSGALNDLCNISNSSSSDQHSSKQVIFSDGIRPGTDLSEPFPYPASPSSSSTTTTTDSPTNGSFFLPSRQHRITFDSGSSSSSTLTGITASTRATTSSSTNATSASASASATTAAHSPSSDTADTASSSATAGNNHRRARRSARNITVCDELGYLPPIVISKEAPISNSNAGQQDEAANSTSSGSLASLILNQFKASKKSIQASMESRSCPLNGIVKFEEISNLVGVNNVITFLLLKSFYLKVKIVEKVCCIDRNWSRRADEPAPANVDLEQQGPTSLMDEIDAGTGGETEKSNHDEHREGPPEYWCFTSSGLDKLGQDEIVFILDKDKGNSCIPRDIFKVFLTLHELALRRQAIENLGNLLFQDGLFGSRDTAGLLFVQPSRDHCFQNLVLPDSKFLVALVLQRWEVPWSKVFPMRLLLRLGHKYDAYPYPMVSHRTREPVYYEIGHTIISILGDFRNFRYSLTHVDGLRVMLNKTLRKVTVQLHQSGYMQFSKVLDSSNNEHVLAWSACPFPETDGHLVSVQNDEGQYETVEFYKKSAGVENISFRNLETGPVLGASFVVFSGALKPKQSGQPAKISIVEDGLLIQIQSCTMSALRNAIHYMDNFDIDCENAQDPLNRVEMRWRSKEIS